MTRTKKETVNRRSAAFGRARGVVTAAAFFIAIIYAIAHSYFYSRRLLSFEGGIPTAKVLIATFQGVTAGLAIWGLAELLSVAFAPENWLQHSKTGKQWMKRSGLKSQRTVGLRVLAIVVSIALAAWFLMCIDVLSISLSSRRP